MQRDDIMRLIEQIAALVASIVAKERAGQHPEARAEVDAKSRAVIGLGLDGHILTSAHSLPIMTCHQGLNQVTERTATRRAFTFWVASGLSLRFMLSPDGRR